MHPRLITENACVALTRRTSFRKAFLAPWAGSSRDVVSSAAANALKRTSSAPRWDEVGQIFAYAAALAQRATKVDWHQLVLNVTHHHSQATPRDRELAEATRILHRTTACALNWLLRERGFDAPGSVFDKRQTHWMTLVDLEAVTQRTIYDDVNCVAAGWVAHPLDVPVGHHLGFDLWKAGGIAVPKPENDFFSEKLPKELELRLTPPIALVRQFDGDLDAIVAALSELRDVRLETLARERRSPVRGVKKLRAVHPWDEPDTDKEVIGRPVRTFAVGRNDDEGVAVWKQCLHETYGHRSAHAERIVRWKAGDRRSAFPAGTLRGYTFLGMPLDVPELGAILGAPHPSREEVEAELAEKRAQRAKLEAAQRERKRVRDARRERARELAEHEDLDRELEDEARRLRVIDVVPIKKPALKPNVDATTEPKSIV
ncbi:MAG: hypothetical protein MUE69_25000, partial [Myxococcota bacterium]|nr:hypothetical protein [Myxococcota bacterium]